MQPEVRMSFGERDLDVIHRALDIAANSDGSANREVEFNNDIRVSNKINKKLNLHKGRRK